MAIIGSGTSLRPLLCRLVGPPVFHNSLQGREVTLPCSYPNTFPFYRTIQNIHSIEIFSVFQRDCFFPFSLTYSIRLIMLEETSKVANLKSIRGYLKPRRGPGMSGVSQPRPPSIRPSRRPPTVEGTMV